VGWVREFLRKEPGDIFFGPVQPVGGQTAAGGVIEPESAYLSLSVESMRIPAVRERGQTFYGTVVSTCSVVSRSGQPAELFAVSAPGSLRAADPRHLDRVIVGTVPLVSTVPYRGGGLGIEIGLFALPGDYLMGPYLDFLGNVAAVGSAFLPPVGALAVAALTSPVRKGLDLLFGAATDARLTVGLDHTWQAPATGYYAVVRAAEPQGGFRVVAGGQLISADGTEVHAPYLVLRIDAQRERHNWADIPQIRAAYETVADASRRGDLVDAREALATFRRVAVFCPDLLATDGERLHQKVTAQVQLAFPSTGTSGGSPRELPDLAQIGLYRDSP
jgi:hypothetical protein